MSPSYRLWLIIVFSIVLIFQLALIDVNAENSSKNAMAYSDTELISSTSENILDPNWLYSAISQSSAAIVGIVGALITSKIIMVSGEKSSLLKRKRELELEIKSLSQSNENKQKYCDNMDHDNAIKNIEDFLEVYNIDIKKLKGHESFEDLWNLYCDFQEDDDKYCSSLHKKVLRELIE